MAEGRLHLGRLWRGLADIAVFSACVNALLLVVPLYLMQVYDRVLPAASADTLVYLSAMAAGALALLGVLETVRGAYGSRLAARLDVAAGRKALICSMDAPEAGLGDVQPLRDLSALRRFLSSRTAYALFDLPFAPLFIVLLWLVHPALFWLAAGGAALLAALAIINQFITGPALRRAATDGAAEMITAQSFVRSSETLRSMGMVENAVSSWGELHVLTMDAADRACFRNALSTGLSRFLRIGLQVAILGTGAWLVLKGEMTAGMIFASSIVSGRGLQPIDQAIGGWPQIAEAKSAWKRLSSSAGVRGGTRKCISLPAPTGRLEIENVTYVPSGVFGRPQPILKRVSLCALPGTLTCVVGPSGAGKSSLARIAVGVLTPTAGTVRIDGGDIRNRDPEDLGRYVGYLAQDADLLPGTVAQNIGRFSPDTTGEEIVAAAKRAHVHDLVQSLPRGYDTLIGPLGVALSGGQRQRIGLARAFFGNPRLVILDEPNSNLDAEGDGALERTLEEARTAGITVIVITQRKAVARRADAVVVMQEGAVADSGQRDEVLHRQELKLAAIRSESGSKVAKLRPINNVASSARADHASSGKETPRGAGT